MCGERGERKRTGRQKTSRAHVRISRRESIAAAVVVVVFVAGGRHSGDVLGGEAREKDSRDANGNPSPTPRDRPGDRVPSAVHQKRIAPPPPRCEITRYTFKLSSLSRPLMILYIYIYIYVPPYLYAIQYNSVRKVPVYNDRESSRLIDLAVTGVISGRTTTRNNVHRKDTSSGPTATTSQYRRGRRHAGVSNIILVSRYYYLYYPILRG